MTERIEVQGQPIAIEAHDQPGCRVEIMPLTDVTDAYKDQLFLSVTEWTNSRTGPTLMCTRINGTILVESMDTSWSWSPTNMQELTAWLMRPMAMSASANAPGWKMGQEDIELATG